jgi:hypothetical protein
MIYDNNHLSIIQAYLMVEAADRIIVMTRAQRLAHERQQTPWPFIILVLREYRTIIGRNDDDSYSKTRHGQPDDRSRFRPARTCYTHRREMF